jgi:AcrR family transcriptional regulator
VSTEAQIPPHIVDAARHVLAQDGLEAATLERISEAAGVSRMTLHRRGVSKERILSALAEQLEDEYRDAFWPALVSTASGRERLTLALANVCAVTERNLGLDAALSAQARRELYHERDTGSGAMTRAVFVEPLERLLLDGAADGSLAPQSDPAETATLLFNATTHTYGHMRSGHGWTPERAGDALLRLLIDGLAAAPPRARAGGPARPAA